MSSPAFLTHHAGPLVQGDVPQQGPGPEGPKGAHKGPAHSGPGESTRARPTSLHVYMYISTSICIYTYIYIYYTLYTLLLLLVPINFLVPGHLFSLPTTTNDGPVLVTTLGKANHEQSLIAGQFLILRQVSDQCCNVCAGQAVRALSTKPRVNKSRYG